MQSEPTHKGATAHGEQSRAIYLLGEAKLARNKETTIRIVIAVLLSTLLWPLAVSTPEGRHVEKKNSSSDVVTLTVAKQSPESAESSQPEKKAEAAATPPAIVRAEKPTPPPTPTVLNDKQAILQAAGVPSTDWPAVEFIFHKESTWRPTVTNNIGCIGLGQNCPDKNGNLWLTDACPNWQTDPVCQVKRFSHYATERYGGWWLAHAFWIENSWW